MCSILEAVLLSLSSTDIAGMSEKHPRASAIWKHLKENAHQPIAVILIVNTFAHTIGASVSGAQFDRLFGHQWIILYSIVYSLIMIQWTEILPKSLAIAKNRSFAQRLAIPMNALMRIFAPAVYVVDLINRPFAKQRKREDEGPVSDIAVLARYAHASKMITDRQEMIVEHGLQLSKIAVSDIMIPRDEIKTLSDTMNLAEALIEAHIHHHTRFPLARNGSLDDIIGYVNFKDVVSAMQLNPKDPTLKGICRPVMKVDQDETVSQLLNKLIKGYQHLVVVTGPSGRTVGVVTLEDIIESIVGEINDEYDLLPEYVYQIAENRYVAGGGVQMARLSSEFCRPLSGKNESLSEWVISLLGRTPKPEDSVVYEDLSVNVRKIRRGSIYEAVLSLKPAPKN
jgi:CBS domain containing-hemolysin-like protein